MNKHVDAHSHECNGFKILVKFGAWRTAVLNPAGEQKPESISYMERHMETDEVFLLLKGKANLIIGGDGDKPEPIEVLPMDLLKTYNVKIKVWHAVIMSPDASIYIVENVDTGKQNGEYYTLNSEEKKSIQSHVL